MSRSFFAMVSRMKYITRWALMRNTVTENISEHSHEVACIAHALAVLGNKRLGKAYNCERAALLGLYHDMPEILTGDMPTPVKYFSSGTRQAYKTVEDAASEKIVTMLPEDLKEEYSPLFFKKDEDTELWRLVKAADKISFNIEQGDKLQFYLDEEGTNRFVCRTGCSASQLEVTYAGAQASRPPEMIDVDGFIGVKSHRARGKRVTTFEVASLRFIEPEEPETPSDGMLPDDGDNGEPAAESVPADGGMPARAERAETREPQADGIELPEGEPPLVPADDGGAELIIERPRGDADEVIDVEQLNLF